MHIHVSILPKTPFPSRLAQNIEQSSMCYTVGFCWLSILNIAHSTILNWRIPWTEDPGGLQSMGSQRIRHN